MLDRRDFLKASTLASVGAGAMGCAGQGDGLLVVPSSSLTALDMEHYLAKLDRSMQVISTKESSIPKIFASGKRLDTAANKETDVLLRKNLRSLLLVGSMHDLPEEGRVHPGMQARLWNAMPEMDEAMLGTHKALDALTPTERADIGRAMRADPELGMRIIEAIDQEAAEQGVPMERRMHLRSLAGHVCSRLKQSSSLLIDEYTSKVQKVIDRPITAEDVQRRLIAQLGEEQFFALRDRQFQLAERWKVAQAQGPQAYPYAYGPPPQQQAGPKPGTSTLTVGAILLGLGVVVFVAGILISAGSLGGLFVATAGAILGIAGLVTLIVGAVIRATAD